jgi:fructose 1,6-bisphosphate aldolase/phosphatase
MSEKLTLSVIKADIGGYVGHSAMHVDLVTEATRNLEVARNKGTIIDFDIQACGDDLNLIFTHDKGIDHPDTHKMAWDTFLACTETAKQLKLYGAGQDLLSDAFSGNIKGMGPGTAEMEISERKAEPVLVFMADKTSAGAWNLPLYKMFADPFNTAGLIISPALHSGFRFEVHDLKGGKKIVLDTPEEIYDLLVFIGTPGRYAIKAVYTKNGEIGAVSSTQRLALIAGRYVGKDDPVCIVRAQSQFPAVGEILEPFTMPFIVEGWMRGSHHGPLMPVSFETATPSRFDGPPRVIAAGYQIANGELIGPRDMFADPGFDHTRAEANQVADYLRRHGPFEPHRLPLDEMEYTTMPEVMKKLVDRWQEIS